MLALDPGLHNLSRIDFRAEHNRPQPSCLQVYDALGKPIVASVLSGYNATVFAYGQSGTGKSHTVHGSAVAPEQVSPAFPSLSSQLAHSSLVH